MMLNHPALLSNGVKNNPYSQDYQMGPSGPFLPGGQVFRKSLRWTKHGTEYGKEALEKGPPGMSLQALAYHEGHDCYVESAIAHGDSTYHSRFNTDACHEVANHILDTRQSLHINHLPPEILGEIFIRCLPDDDLLRGPHYSTQDTPVFLTHVCGYWRDVACSLSILWSSFSVNVFRSDIISITEGLNTWLKRSQSRPLTFRLVCFELVPMLLPHIHRWEHIEFLVKDENAQQILALPMASAPALKSVRVENRNCSLQALDKVVSLVQSIPTLRRLSWRCRHTLSPFLDVSFSQLTDVVLPPDIRLDHLISFLRGCEQLVSIEAKRLLPPPMPMTDTVIVLPRLVSLDVASAKNMRDLLDRLTLPSLLRLRLQECTKVNVTYRKHETLANLVARSSCTLESLELDDFEITEDDLIGYLTLPCLQYVQELYFTMVRNFSERAVGFLVYRTPDHGEGNIFPRLTRLRVGYCTAPDGLFSEMVASRWRPSCRPCEDEPSSLLFVAVSFSGPAWSSAWPEPPHDLDIARFKELIDCGLDVRYDVC